MKTNYFWIFHLFSRLKSMCALQNKELSLANIEHNIWKKFNLHWFINCDKMLFTLPRKFSSVKKQQISLHLKSLVNDAEYFMFYLTIQEWNHWIDVIDSVNNRRCLSLIYFFFRLRLHLMSTDYCIRCINSIWIKFLFINLLCNNIAESYW